MEAEVAWIRYSCFPSMLRILNALPRLKFIANEPLTVVLQCLGIQQYPYSSGILQIK